MQCSQQLMVACWRVTICPRKKKLVCVCVCLCDPCDTSPRRAASFSAAWTALHQAKWCCALGKGLRDNPRLVCVFVCAPGGNESVRAGCLCEKRVCTCVYSYSGCVSMQQISAFGKQEPVSVLMVCQSGFYRSTNHSIDWLSEAICWRWEYKIICLVFPDGLWMALFQTRVNKWDTSFLSLSPPFVFLIFSPSVPKCFPLSFTAAGFICMQASSVSRSLS